MRLKALLAILGIAVGIGSLFLVEILKFSQEKESQQYLKNIGSNILSVRVTPGLSTSEYRQLEENLSTNQTAIYPYTALPVEVYDKGVVSGTIIAIAPKLLSLLKLSPSSHIDVNTFCFIGEMVNQQRESKSLLIGHRYYDVQGVVGKNSLETLMLDYDSAYSIFIPYEDAKYFTHESVESFIIELPKAPSNGFNALEEMKIQLKNEFQEEHHWFFRDAQSKVNEILVQHEKTQSIFNTIAWIALILGTLSSLNLSLLGIVQRYPEIGLRMSLGASIKDIRLLFLSECMMLNLMGGIIGILGAGLVLALYQFTHEQLLSFSIITLWSPLMMSLLSGLATGILPAYIASRYQPSQLLQSG